MPSTVLIITNDHDEHANAVIEELHRRDVPVFRFHPEDFPDKYSVSMEIRDGRVEGEIRTAERRLALEDICAAWYRRSRNLFAPPPSLNLLYGGVLGDQPQSSWADRGGRPGAGALHGAGPGQVILDELGRPDGVPQLSGPGV
jgi:hypothetical protein